MTAALFDRAAHALVRAETAIRLLDRVVPTNARGETERLRGALARSERVEPRWVYAPRPVLTGLRRALAELRARLLSEGALGRQYAARAEELELEAALAECVGAPEFGARSRLRFPEPAAPCAADADALAERFLASLPPRDAEPGIPSDAAHPESLASVLSAWISARKLPVRVELRPALGSVAAAGDGVVLVRPGVMLRAAQARRIALHELEAHVVPRLAARGESCGLFLCGAAGSAEEEEGRALLIEERAGLLDATRRRELGLRHIAARAVRAGADLEELLRELRARGAERDEALEVALRASRGGGLAREIVYLPAYLRLREAFARQPALETFFERGRISLAALSALPREVLRDFQARSTTTGA
ncbi:MAG TPA: tyrosine/phenylalanine carboxypeptidase domain-containing protein [Polyangiaceae bacterium]|nr:tyrosine/phenylalanine carboxypeptidase domain-containing protein [Polyangiaceae bacterium]